MQGPDVYAFCLCERPDLLSQWRGYGQHGGGYAIGFETARLQSLLQWAEGQYLIKVTYEQETQFGIAQRGFMEIMRVLIDFERGLPPARRLAPDDARRISSRFRSALLAEQIRLAAGFKHPAFEGEHEWRMLQFVHPEATSLPVHFRPDRAHIVPYVKMAFPSQSDG